MMKFVLLGLLIAILAAGCATDNTVKIIKINNTGISPAPNVSATTAPNVTSNVSGNATTNAAANVSSNNTNATANITNTTTAIKVRNLTVDFIDMEGNSILIRTPLRKNILIDGGQNSDGLKLVKYLINKGISKFDYVFNSNAEPDNAGGLPSIIFNFNESHAYYSGLKYDDMNHQGYLSYQHYAKAYSYDPIAMPESETFDVEDGLEINAFVPYKNESNGLSADDTIVFRMDYADASFLFLGDCSGVCFDKIRNENIKADVLKANGVVTQEVIDAVSPKIIVYDTITGGTIKPVGTKIYSKADGTVMIMTDGEKYYISTIGKA
jgi:beta-lactamase superfamily II metal-dependent hydrolase